MKKQPSSLKMLVLVLLATMAMPISCLLIQSCPGSLPPTPPSVVIDNDPLTQAIKSAVMIKIDFTRTGGTGVIIGRNKIADDRWRYHILTAYHVIDDLINGIKNHPEDYDTFSPLTIVTQDSFHGLPTIYQTRYIDAEVILPAYDWAVFVIELPVKLPCAVLATRKEFESIKPSDHIYGIGSDGLRGLLFREGVMSSTNNIEPIHRQGGLDQFPWDLNPEKFFRPHQNVWYGVSGGPIFNRDGIVIGIYNGMALGAVQPVPHTAIALKAHFIREILERINSKIITIED